MKKIYIDMIRTVAFRILPALAVAFALIFSLAAPAAAIGFDYSDYIFHENDGEGAYTSTSLIPVVNASWNLLGFPSQDLLAEGVNGDYFYVDHSQIFLDHAYTLVCEPFGSAGIDVTNIRTGSSMDFSFVIDTSVTDSAYEFVKFSLILSYWTSDNQFISQEIYDYSEHSHFGIFDIYDLEIYQPAAADHMRISLFFEEYDLYSYQSGDRVGFAIDSFRLTLRQPKSIFKVTLYDYSGKNLIDTFRDINFPCTVRVNENGFSIYNSESSSADYTYTYFGDSKFLGISQVAYNRDEYWSPGSEFQLTQPDKLYLRLESDETGYIEILNYTGSYTMDRIYEVKFPCKVHVATDGLYFTYAGSGDVSYFFPYGLISNVIGVSQVMCDSVNQYPIGSTFILTSSCNLYINRDGDLPQLPSFGGSGDGSDFDPNDFDSSYVDGVFSEFSEKLNSSFNYIFQLFWRSELLHSILLMSAVFSIFSFLMFGKKG